MGISRASVVLTKAIAKPCGDGTQVAAHADLVNIAHVAYPLIFRAARPVFIESVFSTHGCKRAHTGFKTIVTTYIGFSAIALAPARP